MSWRDILPVHPAADALPLLDGEQLKELANDLKKNGLREPPVVWREGPEDGPVYRLIDGRNRLDAIELLCGAPILRAVNEPAFERMTYRFEDRVTRKFGRVMPMLDIEPIAHGLILGQSKYDNVTPDDPAGYVISLNLKRRHLRPRDLVLHAMAVRAAIIGCRSKPISGSETRDEDGHLRQTRTNDRVSGGRGNKGEATEIAEQTGVPARTVRRVIAESRPSSPKPHNYSLDLRAATNKLVSIVRAVRDEEWAPDTTEATLLTFLARALTEIGQAHGAEPKPGNVIDEVEAYLATEGRRP